MNRDAKYRCHLDAFKVMEKDAEVYTVSYCQEQEYSI